MTLPDATIYHTPVKTIKGYTGKRGTKHSPLSSLANVSVIRAAFPHWSRLQHAARAMGLRVLERQADNGWSNNWDAAYVDRYGRLPVFGDYRIAGIGDDGIGEHWKEKLRAYASYRTQFGQLASLHEAAAGIMAMRQVQAMDKE